MNISIFITFLLKFGTFFVNKPNTDIQPAVYLLVLVILISNTFKDLSAFNAEK